jgi:superfamily II DNA or RNA helicase
MKHMEQTNNRDTDGAEWVWSETYREHAKVVDRLDLWDSSVCRIWLLNRDTIVMVPTSDITPITGDHGHSLPGATEAARIRYLLMAARLSNLITDDILLAPIDASLIPLPHQIKALRKAISRDKVRFLLADEVGLGKTIEAGLILRELKLRGLVNRTLVIVPRGLVTQWIAEMQTHFGEEFRFYSPADFPAYRRIAQSENVWQTGNQIICSLDSVKPVDSRKGWTEEQLAKFNQDRFLDLISAGWDMIIVDEAHRLGGSSVQVARHQLGKGLAEAAPYLLLLSATPHQGKSDAFHRLLTLLDRTAFPDPASIVKERVLPYVIRTEKRHAIDAGGKPLFQPRITKLVAIPWKAEHDLQKLLYESVTEYVREGYNQAMKEKKGYIGFLLILMQRLVTSSSRAIAATLARRLEVLEQPEEQMGQTAPLFEEEWPDLDGQGQLDSVLNVRLDALRNEKAEVRRLLDLARQVEARGPDARAEALLEWIYTLQNEEAEPDLKLLIFTEFIPTQKMLDEFLTNRGFSIVCLNGSLNMEQRVHVQERFAKDVRILISTDAGGEGLNLQFCHVVVNYDLPWNPMRIEQRIGRVDRIGQPKVVRALNFVLEDTIECRVREVLEEKLSVILREFGVDKTGDVLDSLETGNIFEGLFIEALLHPDKIGAEVQRTIKAIQEEADHARAQQLLFDDPVALETTEAQQVQNMPLGEWIEQMTVNYVTANHGTIKRRDGLMELRWPNETESRPVAFPSRKSGQQTGVEVLSLEHSRIRGLLSRLPRHAPGQAIHRIKMEGIPATIQGFWSLWQIGMLTSIRLRHRVLPVFVHDDGRNLQPTARFVWDELNTNSWQLDEAITSANATDALDRCEKAAHEQGREVYLQLRQKHLNHLEWEREKVTYSFLARRKLLASIGLPEVRNHRLRQLVTEEEEWKQNYERQKQALPDLAPIVILRIN